MDGRYRGYPLVLGAALLAVCVPLACSDPSASLARGVAQSAGNLRVGPAYEMSRVAFVLVDTGEGVNMTVEEATSFLQGPAPAGRLSLRDFVLESSYGMQTLAPQVFGPLSYPIADTCNTSGLPPQFRAMVDQMGGGAFNHYIWYFGHPTAACAWSQMGEIGRPERPANDGWINGALPCAGFAAYGWNVGMQVSGLMRCGGSVFADDPNVECTEVHAGDPFDAMGAGCGHVNAWQKAYAGWLLGCNGVRVRGGGIFTLVPLELPCDGVQLLQIPMAKQRSFPTGQAGLVNASLTHYYLELRTKRGAHAGSPAVVQVRIGGELRSRLMRGTETWILDLDPATPEVDGMKLGVTFRDPAGGVAFTLTELDDDHAQIAVTADGASGAPTCLDGTSFLPPGPGIASCDPAPATMPGLGGRPGNPDGTGGVPGGGGRSGRGGAGGSGAGASDGAAGAASDGAAGGGGDAAGAGGDAAGAGGGAAGSAGNGAGTGGTAGGDPTGSAGTGAAGNSGGAGIAGPTDGSAGGATLADRQSGCDCVVPGRLGERNPFVLLAAVAGLAHVAGRRRARR